MMQAVWGVKLWGSGRIGIQTVIDTHSIVWKVIQCRCCDRDRFGSVGSGGVGSGGVGNGGVGRCVGDR